MRRTMWFAAVLVAALGMVGPAHAGWDEFWERVHLDWQRNNAWPEPFRLIDRDNLRAPFLGMIDVGWQLQNTIDDQLFDPQTNELLPAGEAKVRWILSQAPAHRRTVFVLKARGEEPTQVRLDSVHQTVANLTPRGPLAPVLVTDVAPPNSSGDYFDQVQRKSRASIPSPRLPGSAVSTGGGGGGAAGGGAK